MPRALITGISGQDGTLLSQRLQVEGWTVVGTVRDESDAQLVSGLGVDTVVADFTDTGRVSQLIGEVRPDLVVNLAGVSSVARSWQQPVETALVNSVAVSALLEGCRSSENDVRFIQASSAEIFGSAPSPQSEETPVAPVNPYGASKAHAHQLAGIYRTRGVRASSAILFNHESILRPPTFVTRKITRGVAAIIAGRADVLELGSLDARRDWSWAGDVVEALMLIAMSPHQDSDYVVASGVSHSVRDFVALAFRAGGVDDWERYVRVSADNLRPADPTDQRGDPSKIRQTLGWEPTLNFEELVSMMVRHDIDETSMAENGS